MSSSLLFSAEALSIFVSFQKKKKKLSFIDLFYCFSILDFIYFYSDFCYIPPSANFGLSFYFEVLVRHFIYLHFFCVKSWKLTSLVGVLFASFFIIPVALCRCLCIWRSTVLPDFMDLISVRKDLFLQVEAFWSMLWP